MATHPSTFAWKIPRMEEPGRLQSIGSLRVGHDRATSLSLFSFMHWRRKWQPTPVFLPGESQGLGSGVGCRLWDHTELDTTEVTQQQLQQQQPQGPQHTRLLCPWDCPGKTTGVGCHSLLQGIFPTQGSTHISCFSCIGRGILYHCITWEAP